MAELSDPKGVLNGIIIRLPVRGTTNWDLDFELETMGPIMAHNHHGNGNGAQLTTDAFTNDAITIDKIAHIQIISEDTTITDSVSNMHYILDSSQSTPVTLTFNGTDQIVDNCLFSSIGKVSTATISLESNIRFMNNRVNSLDSSRINLQNIDLTDFVIENNIIFTNSIVADFQGLDTGITGDNNSSSLFQYNILHVSFQGNNTTPIRMPLGTFSGNKITFIGSAYLQTYVSDNVSQIKHSNIPSNRGNIIDFLDAYSSSNSSYITVDNPTTNNIISFTDTRPFRILSNDTKVSLEPNLGDAQDVNLSNEQTNELLKYDGSQWVNSKVITDSIEDSAVTTAKIADLNVTTAKIADSNVTTAKINDEAITASKLQANIANSDPVKLSSLADVNSAAPSNGQALAWNDTLSAWQPQTIAGGGGGVAENSFVGIITEWQEYTPTFNSGFTVGTGGNATNKFEYRRIGENIEIRFLIELGTSGASMGTGYFEFNLPTGLSMPSEFVQRGDDNPVTGFVRLGNADYPSNTQDQTTQVFVYNGSTTNFIVGIDGNFGVTDATNPWGWNAGDFIVCPSMTVPILGWNAVGLIDQSGSVDVVLDVRTDTITPPQHTDDGNFQVVPFGIVENDTVGGWNASTNQYTIPETGYYDITGAVRTTTSSGAGQIAIAIDGSISYPSESADIDAWTNGAKGFDITFTAKYLQKGQTVEIQFYQSTGGNLTYGTGNCYFQLAKRNTSQAIISGTGSGINYISNSKAIVNLAGWNEYDGTTAIPTGTLSGTASLTLERNEANPLRGSADFKLTTTSASLGEGVAYDFNVQRADLSKKMLIDFEYDTSHINYDDGDVKIFVYDVTNSNLIRVNGEDLKGGKGRHYAQFQTSATGTSYRLLFHVTSANVYSIYLDDIRVSPISVTHGAIITDWKEYTPTFSAGFSQGTNPTYPLKFEYRRVGENIEIRFNLWLGTGGTLGTNPYFSFQLPTGLNASSSTQPHIGIVRLLNGSPNNDDALAEAYLKSGTTNEIAFGHPTELTLVNSTIPWAWDNGDNISGSISVPILGWSSNTVMSEDFSGRDVVCSTEIDGTSTQTFSHNTPSIIQDFIVTTDTTNSFNTSTGVYTVPETGYYDVQARVATDSVQPEREISAALWIFSEDSQANTTTLAADNGILVLGIDPNNINIPYIRGRQSSADCSAVGVYLEKGQLVKLQFLAQTSDGSSVSLSGGVFQIAKRQSAQTVLDTETVAAKAKVGSSGAGTVTTPTGSNFNTLPLTETEFDTHGCFDSATNSLIAPITGYYQVSANILISQITNTSKDANIQWKIVKTSGGISSDETLCWESEIKNYNLSSNQYIRDNASTTIYMEKGDSIKIDYGDEESDYNNVIFINGDSFLTFARIK